MKIMRKAALFAVLLCFTAPVFAQSLGVQILPRNGAGSVSPITNAGADQIIFTPPQAAGNQSPPAVSYLDILNASNTATVCIAFGTTATITGTQCAAGEIPLPPGWHKSWPEGGTFVPTDVIHVIASAAGTQITLTVK